MGREWGEIPACLHTVPRKKVGQKKERPENFLSPALTPPPKKKKTFPLPLGEANEIKIFFSERFFEETVPVLSQVLIGTVEFRFASRFVFVASSEKKVGQVVSPPVSSI